MLVKAQINKGKELLMEIEAMKECFRFVMGVLDAKKRELRLLALKKEYLFSEIEVTERCIQKITAELEDKKRELDKIQKIEERKEAVKMTTKYKVRAKRVVKCRGQSTINIKVTCGLCSHVYYDWVKVNQYMYSVCPNCDAANEFALRTEEREKTVELATVN